MFVSQPKNRMKHLLTSFFVAAAFAASAQTDTIAHTPETVSASNIGVSVMAIVAPSRNMLGVQGGYTSAFATITDSPNGGSLATAPGFSTGLAYRRSLPRRFSLYSGAVYTSKNFRLSAGGSTFDQRNDRLGIPLMVGYPVLFKVRNALSRTSLKLGVQADILRSRRPVNAIDYQTMVQNSVFEESGVEFLAAAEVMYYLPMAFNRQHAISVAYFHGLGNSFTGTLSDPSKTFFSYSNSGSYLEVRYTFLFTRPYRGGW